MKKSLIFIVAITVIALICSAWGCSVNFGNSEKTQYLRIHIRANSNSEEDQEVKYRVKEAVVSFLTPFVADCKTLNEAEKVINGKLSEIEKVAVKTLCENGFSYKAKANVRNEKFPTRVYENLTLSSGYYDALIIELGEASGDNWWCVVYPPLCFTGSEIGLEYRSKIYDLIRNFFN